MLTPSFSQKMANQLFEAAISLISEPRLRELIQCQAYFAWMAGSGRQDPAATADAPMWLASALQLLEELT